MVRLRPTHNPEVARYLRHNFIILALDYGLFGLGMSFSSLVTILPALAERLGAPNLILGALPSLVLLGQSAPALFSARLIEPLPRKLPFVLAYTLWERVPWLGLALAVLFLSESNPQLVTALLVIVLAVVALASGILMPAWLDMVGTVIPTAFRGRFFAVGGAVATVLGLLGALASGFLLRQYPFPRGYALCLGITFLFMMASYVVLAMTREPEGGPVRATVPFGAHLARLPRILAANRSFAWFLAAQAMSVLAMMATAFYTVHALRSLGAQEWNVAGFTFALLAAQAAGGFALGLLADRAGHRSSLLVGAVAAVGCSALALAVHDLVLYHGVFLLLGLSMAATNVSAQTLVLELSPAGERPTYLGLAGTSQAPFALVAPLLAALLVDRWGTEAVFLAAGLVSAAGAAIYLARVEEPPARR